MNELQCCISATFAAIHNHSFEEQYNPQYTLSLSESSNVYLRALTSVSQRRRRLSRSCVRVARRGVCGCPGRLLHVLRRVGEAVRTRNMIYTDLPQKSTCSTRLPITAAAANVSPAQPLGSCPDYGPRSNRDQRSTSCRILP